MLLYLAHARHLPLPSCMVYRVTFDRNTWWRHQMQTFSALLAICAGNSPVTGEFPAQRPVTLSFDVFFDLRLNKRLIKQSWGRWFEMLSRSLWRHRNEWNHHWLTRCLLKVELVLQIRLKRCEGQGHPRQHDSYEADHQAYASSESLRAQPRHGHAVRWHLLPAEINEGPISASSVDPRTHFTNCLWAHHWNLVEIRVVLISILRIQSGQLSWHVQNCNRICSSLFVYSRIWLTCCFYFDLDYELLNRLWNGSLERDSNCDTLRLRQNGRHFSDDVSNAF